MFRLIYERGSEIKKKVDEACNQLEEQLSQSSPSAQFTASDYVFQVRDLGLVSQLVSEEQGDQEVTEVRSDHIIAIDEIDTSTELIEEDSKPTPSPELEDDLLGVIKTAQLRVEVQEVDIPEEFMTGIEASMSEEVKSLEQGATDRPVEEEKENITEISPEKENVGLVDETDITKSTGLLDDNSENQKKDIPEEINKNDDPVVDDLNIADPEEPQKDISDEEEDVKFDPSIITEIIDSLVSKIVISSIQFTPTEAEDIPTTDKDEARKITDQEDKTFEENRSIDRAGYDNDVSNDNFISDSVFPNPVSDKNVDLLLEDQTPYVEVEHHIDENGNSLLDNVQQDAVIEVAGDELQSNNNNNPPDVEVKEFEVKEDPSNENDFRREDDMTQYIYKLLDSAVEEGVNEVSNITKEVATPATPHKQEDADCDYNPVEKVPPTSGRLPVVRECEEETAQRTVAPGFLPLIKKHRGRWVPGSLKKKFVFSSLPGPVGLALLADGSIAVACRNSNTVKRVSRTGNPLCSFKCDDLDKPTDVLQLSNGGVVVRDSTGLKLFSQDLKLEGTIGEEQCNKYYGLAEDSHGHIVTINTNASAEMGRGRITGRKQTDLFYFNKDGNFVKREELKDIVRDEVRVRSMCRYLGSSHGQNKIFIVDMGLHSVYCVADEEIAAFGDPGDRVGEFDVPAGIAVDDHGNSIVVDSNNHRLQLVDSNYRFIGVLTASLTLFGSLAITISVTGGQGSQTTLWNMLRQRDVRAVCEQLRHEHCRLLQSLIEFCKKETLVISSFCYSNKGCIYVSLVRFRSQAFKLLEI